MLTPEQLSKLRTIITENLRVQKGGAKPIEYIDAGNAITDVCSRQNHVIFGRRGCGKSLLLEQAELMIPPAHKVIYLNCEDFKKHSYPDVLIEILSSIFKEIDDHITGWFGRKMQLKHLIADARRRLDQMKQAQDQRDVQIREKKLSEQNDEAAATLSLGDQLSFGTKSNNKQQGEIEKVYSTIEDKSIELQKVLPELKGILKEFFKLSNKVETIFLHVDDFYHLRRVEQPFVIDYIHRLCKGIPIFFKLATLRHATVLYAEWKGQPVGVQQRHDFQPIDVDYSLQNFKKTEDQNLEIFYKYASLAGIGKTEFDSLFKGEGFRRLIVVAGGIPRDSLSLFLEILSNVQSRDGRISKDDVRLTSISNLERKIDELKTDSESTEQEQLLKGIYVIRKFCLDKQTSVFLLDERFLKENDSARRMVFRLLDYRIIHGVGSALTHKSATGSYEAFMIDVGVYGHMRVLREKMREIDLAEKTAKENMRSAPILSEDTLKDIWIGAPSKVATTDLLRDPDAE